MDGLLIHAIERRESGLGSFKLTRSPFIHTTLGAGSPLMGMSSRSLFPATIVTVLSGKFKPSTCTLGGSAEIIKKRLVSSFQSHPGRLDSFCTNDVNFGRQAL